MSHLGSPWRRKPQPTRRQLPGLGLEAQQRELRTAGCRKIFSEQTSSVGPRAQLEAELDYCREGDTLVVTKRDRLARSARHLSELVDQLEAKGVALRVLNFGGDAVDTRGATGRLMLNMFAATSAPPISPSRSPVWLGWGTKSGRLTG
jgi:DNA invertase Pin-like site-specific DNA recombinase